MVRQIILSFLERDTTQNEIMFLIETNDSPKKQNMCLYIYKHLLRIFNNLTVITEEEILKYGEANQLSLTEKIRFRWHNYFLYRHQVFCISQVILTIEM